MGRRLYACCPQRIATTTHFKCIVIYAHTASRRKFAAVDSYALAVRTKIVPNVRSLGQYLSDPSVVPTELLKARRFV